MSFFPFLEDDSGRLSVLFGQYVSGGQWEAARCVLRQLGNNSKSLLQECGNGFVGSRSVPSKAFLQWLVLVEGGFKGKEDEAEAIAFDMAIHACKELASKEHARVLDKVRELGKNPRIDLLKKLSSSELARLREILALFPLLGHSIIRGVQGQKQLYLDVLQGLLSQSHFQEALSFVPFLQARGLTSQESRTLDSVLDKLQNLTKNSPERQFLVYQALLGAQDGDYEVLLEKFGAVEDAAIKLDYREPVPRAFLETNAAKFWHRLHVMSVVVGKHIFEIVLEKALLSVEERRFSDTAILVRHVPLIASLIVAMGLHRMPSFLDQKGLLDAVKESPGGGGVGALHDFVKKARWKVVAAQWCSQQECLGLTADAALGKLARSSLLDIVGTLIANVDRQGLLGLLDVEDCAQCLEYFALQAVLRGDAEDVFGSLQEFQNVERASTVFNKCIDALYVNVAHFSRVVVALRKAWRPQFDESRLREAEFRLHCAQMLSNNESAFQSSPAQLLSDATMAELWDLSREIADFFKQTPSSCETWEFWKTEERIAQLRDSVGKGEPVGNVSGLSAHALADLAFACSQNQSTSVSLLRKAMEAAESVGATAEFLSRLSLIAELRNIPVSQAVVLSRPFPNTVGGLDELREFLAFENRARALAAEGNLAELRKILPNTSPLCRFVDYLDKVASVCGPGDWAERSPEDIVSWLVSERKDQGAARELCEFIEIDLVDALVSRWKHPITLEELELIGRSKPALAAWLAVVRHPRDSYDTLLIDFASRHAVSTLKKVLEACQLFHSAFSLASGRNVLEERPRAAWELLLKGESVEFYRCVVDQLQASGRLEEGLDVADSYLPEGGSDGLLESLALRGGENCWRYVTRMSDRKKAARLALAHVEDMELDAAIDVLEMALHCKQPELEAAAASKLKVLRAYQPVLQHRNVFGPWRDWKELDRTCKQAPGTVIKQLMEWKQFDLAKVISECFQSTADSALLDIDADALLHLLEHGSDAESVAQFVSSLKEPVATVEAVLGATKVPESRLVLWTYLSTQAQKLTPGRAEQVSQHLKGAQILALLPSFTEKALVAPVSRARRGLNFGGGDDEEEESGARIERQTLRYQLQHLEAHADCILETLLMNEKISELNLIFKTLPNLVDHQVIVSYARKALKFDASWSDASAPKANDELLNFSTMSASASATAPPRWILTGNDAVSDMALRRQHFFPSAPNINLATALLDLCTEYRTAGTACVEICSHLSSLLSSTPASSHLLLLNLVKQLLFYATVQFSKSDDAESIAGVGLCQKLLARIDLLHDLHMEDCGIRCSVDDLADPRKARAIRDKLIAQDRMKLASAVATKCAVESEPVWLAWGLRLLRLGEYEAAKEKLNLCMDSSERSASQNNMFDRSSILTQILQILQSYPAESNNIRDTTSMRLELQAMEDLVKQAGGDANAVVFSPKIAVQVDEQGGPKLDAVRYMQCVYYLSRMGTPTKLIRFWLSHGYLEDACRYIIGGGLAPEMFIDEVLTHCLSYGQMKELFACLPRIDPKGSKKTKYLVQACKYLNEAHAFDLLLEFQEFMKDWARAGLTCVKLFHIESNFFVRLDYLRRAKEHFSSSMKELQQQRVSKKPHDLNLTGEDLPFMVEEPVVSSTDFGGASPLTELETSKYYRKVVLQISILEFLDQNQASIPQDEELRKLSMFGSTKERIAERLVVLSPSSDLGFRLMQEFHLPQGEIYARAVADLVRNKRKNELQTLLKAIKGIIDQDEWDTVLLGIVKTYATENNDQKSGEKYITKIHNARAQVKAYRMVGLLKTAYVLAAKAGWVDEISEIRSAAIVANAKNVISLCNSYLASAK